MRNALICAALAAVWVGTAAADVNAALAASGHKVVRQDDWFGGRRTVFDFEGCEAWVVEPPAGVAVREGRPWTWTMQWKDAFVPRTNVPRLLAQGWHHATIETFRRRMDGEGLALSARFQKFLVEKLGFAAKANLIGMSWGGFYSIRYAATYPDCVKRAYLDAPLCDFTSLPPCWTNYVDCATWGVTPDYRGENDPRMPINMARPIAEAGIEILLLYGGQDSLCLPDRNCEVFARRFKSFGGVLQDGVRDDGNADRRLFGHHPHGLEESRQGVLADFFERENGNGAKRP